MKNLLALLGGLFLVLAAVGWYQGWYSIDQVPAEGGTTTLNISIDTGKIREDISKGKDKIGGLLNKAPGSGQEEAEVFNPENLMGPPEPLMGPTRPEEPQPTRPVAPAPEYHYRDYYGHRNNQPVAPPPPPPPPSYPRYSPVPRQPEPQPRYQPVEPPPQPREPEQPGWWYPFRDDPRR